MGGNYAGNPNDPANMQGRGGMKQSYPINGPYVNPYQPPSQIGSG